MSVLVRTAVFCLLLALLARTLLHPASSNVDVLLGTDGVPQRILLLTAHPDDECLFFAPTVSALLAQDPVEGKGAHEVYSLCLSVGNADGLGAVRRGELANSLDVLGVDANKRWVLDHPDLPDNITLTWNEEVLSQVIKPYVTEHRITTILTFDLTGVSSHPNHASLLRGAHHLAESFPASSRPRVFALITVPIIHKYLGPFAAALAKLDLAFASLVSQQNSQRLPVFVSGVDGYKTALRAMKQHTSQLVWFRWLYVSFSRYMWVNEWMELVPPSGAGGV